MINVFILYQIPRQCQFLFSASGQLASFPMVSSTMRINSPGRRFTPSAIRQKVCIPVSLPPFFNAGQVASGRSRQAEKPFLRHAPLPPRPRDQPAQSPAVVIHFRLHLHCSTEAAARQHFSFFISSFSIPAEPSSKFQRQSYSFAQLSPEILIFQNFSKKFVRFWGRTSLYIIETSERWGCAAGRKKQKSLL